jgi:hypothetical protein
MHVRWKRRPLPSQPLAGGGCEGVLCATLVRSERVDGKTRQRTVCRFAPIGEAWLRSPYFRWRFWEDADAKLCALNLDEATLRRIEDRLNTKVPRPTRDELDREEEKARHG